MRSSNVRWARTQLIYQITKLTDNNNQLTDHTHNHAYNAGNNDNNNASYNNEGQGSDSNNGLSSHDWGP